MTWTGFVEVEEGGCGEGSEAGGGAGVAPAKERLRATLNGVFGCRGTGEERGIFDVYMGGSGGGLELGGGR